MNSIEQNQVKIQSQSLVSKMRGKQKLWGKKNNNSISIDHKEDGQCVALNMSIVKPHPKGSLLDRIATLEDRLVQLCLEIESYKKSSCTSSSTDKSSGASSSSGSKLERICSYPTFEIPNPQTKIQPSTVDPGNNNVESEENTNREEEKLKILTSMKKQHQGKKRNIKTSVNGKNIGTSWPHLKILGC